MHSLQSHAPFIGDGVWPPDELNHAIMELRREFSEMPAERIVRALDVAARAVPPDAGRVRLLQRAREALRTGR